MIKHFGFLILALALFSICAMAQTNGFYVGVVENNDVANNAKLSVQYEKLVSGQQDSLFSLYTTTTYDVTGIKLIPKLDISAMQYTALQSGEIVMLKPASWLLVLAKGDIGVNGVSGVTTGFAAGGGGGLKIVHKAFAAKFYGAVIKTTVNQPNFEARAYIGMRF